METLDKLIVEWGVASQTLAGEVQSGDKHVVKSFPHGALLAAVDGLGHGEEAAAAANMAVRGLPTPEKKDPIFVLQLRHQRVGSPPGVVVNFAAFHSVGGAMNLDGGWHDVGSLVP